jgi:CHAT domain
MATLIPTTTNASFPSILSDLWSHVVKPVLDGLAFTVSRYSNSIIFSCNVICSKASDMSEPPRIWWCATGPLAFLPIHAAGIYGNSATAGLNISDYVVSSYTPTINALIKASENYKMRPKFQGLLAVIQPNTPGQSALPNTYTELQYIQQQACNFGVQSLEGSAALVENVVKGMESCSWIHLACHAVQNTAEPTQSAFCLHDGHLELSMIITKSFAHADLAFLSACQTATGDEGLSEESVHLAAAMMLAGYRGVIATIWSIKDEDAPVIADQVYSDLFSKEPDSTRAALALHRAVKHFRQQVGDSMFLSWVPFIHVGM